jgi:hypothetical protein
MNLKPNFLFFFQVGLAVQVFCYITLDVGYSALALVVYGKYLPD